MKTELETRLMLDLGGDGEEFPSKWGLFFELRIRGSLVRVIPCKQAPNEALEYREFPLADPECTLKIMDYANELQHWRNYVKCWEHSREHWGCTLHGPGFVAPHTYAGERYDSLEISFG